MWHRLQGVGGITNEIRPSSPPDQRRSILTRRPTSSLHRLFLLARVLDNATPRRAQRVPPLSAPRPQIEVRADGLGLCLRAGTPSRRTWRGWSSRSHPRRLDLDAAIHARRRAPDLEPKRLRYRILHVAGVPHPPRPPTDTAPPWRLALNRRDRAVRAEPPVDRPSRSSHPYARTLGQRRPAAA